MFKQVYNHGIIDSIFFAYPKYGYLYISLILVFMLSLEWASIIHYGIYLTFNQIGVSLNVAYTFGYAVSFIFNYLASNYFTFKKKPTAGNGLRFAGAHICNYLIQLLLLNGFMYIGLLKSIVPIFVFVIAVPINFILVRTAFKSKN